MNKSTEKYTEFSRRLTEARQGIGISKAELARMIKVSEAYIGQLERITERKNKSPSWPVITSIAAALGVNPAWLKSGEGVKHGSPAASGLTNPSAYPDLASGPGAAAKGLTPVVADSRQTVMFAGDPPALRLRKDQAELLREWDRLNKEDQQLIVDVMRSMARKG